MRLMSDRHVLRVAARAVLLAICGYVFPVGLKWG
jgi:hypothetical protein